VSQTSRSANFIFIASRASNVLRLGLATAALQRHPAKHAAMSGCALTLAPRLIYRRSVSCLCPIFFLFFSLKFFFLKTIIFARRFRQLPQNIPENSAPATREKKWHGSCNAACTENICVFRNL
jgi:hypothetical protein